MACTPLFLNFAEVWRDTLFITALLSPRLGNQSSRRARDEFRLRFVASLTLSSHRAGLDFLTTATCRRLYQRHPKDIQGRIRPAVDFLQMIPPQWL